MNIEIPDEIGRKALAEWKKLPKFNTFTSTMYGNTEQFKCKYPNIYKIMKDVEIGLFRARK